MAAAVGSVEGRRPCSVCSRGTAAASPSSPSPWRSSRRSRRRRGPCCARVCARSASRQRLAVDLPALSASVDPQDSPLDASQRDPPAHPGGARRPRSLLPSAGRGGQLLLPRLPGAAHPAHAGHSAAWWSCSRSPRRRSWRARSTGSSRRRGRRGCASGSRSIAPACRAREEAKLLVVASDVERHARLQPAVPAPAGCRARRPASSAAAS